MSIRDFLFTSSIRNLQVISPLGLMVGPKANDKDLQAKIDGLWYEKLSTQVGRDTRACCPASGKQLQKRYKINQHEGDKNKMTAPTRISHPE